MEGKKFLNVAQKMLQIRSEEATRSAFSRIYYAVFNTGAKLLNELGFVLPKDGTAHERLYQPPLRNQLKTGIQEYERQIGFNS